MRQYIFVITILFVSLLSTMPAYTQLKISGVVKDVNENPIRGANVLVLRAGDSLLVKGILTETSGNFNFANIPPGNYIISASFTGFRQYFSEQFTVDTKDINTGIIVLQSEDKKLETVTVTARKPLFEQKIDRMVINVKNSITSAGSTALEVLERSPGVIVNRQSNSIALSGKEGVVVMINGKISRMPLNSVLQLLSGMSSSNIERIELITTPPANFDAEGNAGFINIVLIDNPNKGLNGSVVATIGYGKGYTTDGSVNFNYRNKLINLYGNYSFTWNNQLQEFSFFRRSLYQGIVKENSTVSDRHPKDGFEMARIGLDIQLTPKTIIGVLAGGYNSKWTMDAYNTLLTNRNGIPDSSVYTVNRELNQWKHAMGNINFSHKANEDETISADLDYLDYTDNNPNDYNNKYYNSAGTLLNEELTKSSKLTPISLWVGKVDYTKKISKRIKAEAGVKIYVSKFTNDVAVERWQQDQWVKDSGLTAKYFLKENVAAAYSSFNITASEKTAFKLGLRYEYTTSNLGSVTQADIVDRKYGRLFPSIFMSQKLNDNHSFNFSYSRRITRPTFNDMAPFVIFMDPYTFFSGNSALQPAFSNSFKVDYLFKNMAFSAVYTKEDHSIANFQLKIDSITNSQVYASENLDNIKTFNLSASVPITITKWWSMQNNIQGTWQQTNAQYNKRAIRIEQKYVQFYSGQTFTLPKDFSLELSGFYQTKALFGTNVIKPVGQLNFGAQKKIGKGRVRFNVSDIFVSGIFSSVTDLPQENIYVKGRFQFSQRTFKLTYSYNFGNNNLNAKRDRSGASEEEQRRVH